MKLRFGLIGAGSWALESHLPNLEKRRSDIKFVGVCRPGRDEVRWVGDHYGFDLATENYEDVLDAGVDIVVVSSPSALHYTHARDALRAGAHVLVEKPFTISSEEAWDLVEVAREAQRHLLVAFGYNYKPLVRTARRQLAEHGGVGVLESLSVSMSSVCRELLAGGGSYPKANTRFRPEACTWSDPAISGGGYAQAQLTHALGLAMHLVHAEPQSVFATLTNPVGGEVEQHCAGVLTWADAVIGSITGNATHEGAAANRDMLRVQSVGSEGQFRLDMDRDGFEYFRRETGDLGYTGEPGAGAYDCDGPPDALVDLALGRIQVNESSAELAAKTVQVVEGIYRSARSGQVERCDRPIRPPDEVAAEPT